MLDECVDGRLRTRIPGHEVYTVAYMGWAGTKNGELLRLAAAHGFEALLTTDRSIRHQHNPATLPLSVIWLDVASDDVDDLLPLVEPLLALLLTLTPRTFGTVP